MGRFADSKAVNPYLRYDTWFAVDEWHTMKSASIAVLLLPNAGAYAWLPCFEVLLNFGTYGWLPCVEVLVQGSSMSSIATYWSLYPKRSRSKVWPLTLTSSAGLKEEELRLAGEIFCILGVEAA